MPEYLAPGVYVEETSFRAKSIEGVGTSTTAFVGPTRKGPISTTLLDSDNNPPAPPELLTSFGDFVRIYGGLGNFDPSGANRLNYLAHSVLNYFNEGGSRLYVSRVANAATSAAAELAGSLLAPDDDSIFLRARFPGESGNGATTLKEVLFSTTRLGLDAQPAGALLRASGSTPTEPARISGGSGQRMTLADDAVLRIMLNGVARNVTFRGAHTEAIAPNALANPVAINNANNTLDVAIDGGAVQSILLADGNYTPAQIALAINEQLSAGYARLQNNDTLAIGSDTLGHNGTVDVTANADFGYDADLAATANFGPVNNNLPNFADVSAADLARAIEAQVQDGASNPEVTAALSGGRLVLSTVALGDQQTLAVADATDLAATPPVASAHASLGFAVVPGAQPARGSNIRLYAKQDDGSWQDSADTALPLPPNASDVAGNLISTVVVFDDADGETEAHDEISLVRGAPRYIGTALGMSGVTRADSLQRLFGFQIGANVDSLELHAALFPAGRATGDLNEGLSATHTLANGTAGGEPAVGDPTQNGSYAAAFEQLRGLEDISIVAAPGHSSFDASNYRSIQGALRSHAERPRAYRIAVLDTPPNQLPSEARTERAQIDSTRAALYYPWVTVANPLARPGRDDIPKEINLPPSGFICGIYARNDAEKGVAKAPANEVVRGALRFESDVNFAHQQLLNPLGVNCLRYLSGRGYRVWGARTATSDPEWKYVNVRRFFLYLESSIDRGTQWAVFENNGPRLWNNIRETIEAFLYNEWVSGNLLGSTPKEAYFVRCDRSTMTQSNLDNGQLICLIGVAALKPAEFVIFRIGQKTADAQS